MVQVKPKKGGGVRDFKKVKAKGYGKTKPKANVVNTQLRTRALMMPYQKVTDAARLDREEVTRRNLSLDELLGKLNHHNNKARTRLALFSLPPCHTLTWRDQGPPGRIAGHAGACGGAPTPASRTPGSPTSRRFARVGAGRRARQNRRCAGGTDA